MKEALWGYWLIILGIFIIVVLLLVQSFTSTNTQDYYLVKTITEAAMEDALDWSYYRLYGEIKINKEKFYECFLRRFAEEASLATTYTIEFNEVYEAPPKVGVKVSSKSSTFNIAGDSTTFDIVNKIDAILENRTTTSPVVEDDDNNWSAEGGDWSSNDGSDPNETGFTVDTNTKVITDCSSVAEKALKEKGIDICNKTTSEVSAIASASGTSFNDNNAEEVAKVAGALNSKIDCMSDERLKEVANVLSPSLMKKEQSEVTNMQNSLKAVLDKGCGGENNVATTCDSSNSKEIDASGVSGYAMGAINVRAEASSNSQLVKTLNGGDSFKIVGQSTKSNDWFLAELSTGECGYVYNKYVAVNMQEFFSKNGVNNVQFNITNQSSSIYAADDNGTRICNQATGRCISGVTLYSGAYKPLGVYVFAQKVMKAAQKTSRTLVIYDAYRPHSVTQYMYDVYGAYLDKYADEKYRKAIDNYGRSWFLAKSVSKHNTACAIDVTFAGANMPTKMHVLNVAAAGSNASAKELENLFKSVGLSTIKSEWWHYQQDSGCYDTIKKISPNGASFWSAV